MVSCIAGFYSQEIKTTNLQLNFINADTRDVSLKVLNVEIIPLLQ